MDIEEFALTCTLSSDLYGPQLLTLKPFPACIVSLGSISGHISHTSQHYRTWRDEDITFDLFYKRRGVCFGHACDLSGRNERGCRWVSCPVNIFLNPELYLLLTCLHMPPASRKTSRTTRTLLGILSWSIYPCSLLVLAPSLVRRRYSATLFTKKGRSSVYSCLFLKLEIRLQLSHMHLRPV